MTKRRRLKDELDPPAKQSPGCTSGASIVESLCVGLMTTAPTAQEREGTNSHDRRAGAEGILRTLLDQGALGMVTTHDLALTSIADVFPGRIRNVHFQERLDAGKLSFDYRLREGVVTTSNGIELMKSIGLEV